MWISRDKSNNILLILILGKWGLSLNDKKGCENIKAEAGDAGMHLGPLKGSFVNLLMS